MSSPYPPGVTGNEAQISGEPGWPWYDEPFHDPNEGPLEDATEVAEREAELAFEEHLAWLTKEHMEGG